MLQLVIFSTTSPSICPSARHWFISELQFLKISYVVIHARGQCIIKPGFHIDVSDGDDGNASGTFLKC